MGAAVLALFVGLSRRGLLSVGNRRPGLAAPTAGFIHITYDVLYNDDCGIGGHVGDDERFAITVNPSMPPPLGIVSIKGISHKGSVCEKESDCGRCAGQSACATLLKDGTPWPAVWVAKNKHGSYVNRSSTCEITDTCLDQCQDNSAPATGCRS